MSISTEFLNKIEKIRAFVPEDLPIFEYESRLYLAEYEKNLSRIRERVKASGSVLDLGCSFGHLSAVLADYGYTTVGLDVPYEKHQPDQSRRTQAICKMRPELWRKIEKEFNCSFLTGDGKSLPFEDNHFDAVLAYAVIEHVPNTTDDCDGVLNFLGEVNRVLKEDGFLFIFECPNEKAYTEKMAAALNIGHHELRFDEPTLKSLLERQNFNIVDFFTTEMIPYYMLTKSLQKIWNRCSQPLSYMDSMLLKSPFSAYHHHFNVITRKQVLSKKH